MFEHWEEMDIEDIEDSNSLLGLVNRVSGFENEDVVDDYTHRILKDLDYNESSDTLNCKLDENSAFIDKILDDATKLEYDGGVMTGFNAGLAIKNAYSQVKENDFYTDATTNALNGVEIENPERDVMRTTRDILNSATESLHGFRTGLLAAEYHH